MSSIGPNIPEWRVGFTSFQTTDQSTELCQEGIKWCVMRPAFVDLDITPMDNVGMLLHELALKLHTLTWCKLDHVHGLDHPPCIQRRSTALLILSCYWPCRNPCLFEVELATNILSLYIYTLKRV
jgi:hypothetical protein